MGKNEKEKNKEISIFHERDMVDNLKNTIILMTILNY
jgi:hypothetical protein